MTLTSVTHLHKVSIKGNSLYDYLDKQLEETPRGTTETLDRAEGTGTRKKSKANDQLLEPKLQTSREDNVSHGLGYTSESSSSLLQEEHMVGYRQTERGTSAGGYKHEWQIEASLQKLL
ncbi:hypothetical protein Nepgr_022362 [Nepenthes gracilis]|uniref:Uncharacterized protein n=1 Tax=Nepenthes gracilis TaxID=150966 RepID=A0AAD3XYB7_NEPGR|nr:hypothetical protein Nepgr_022362 [Nepenthes gracilis]